MFGYIVPFVPELKVRDLGLFRGYYCGLCRALKTRYGRIGILNYDATFLYMLLDGLESAEPGCEPVRCIVHPWARHPAIQSAPGIYAADINVLMAWAKADDDQRDEGGTRTVLRKSLLERAFRKASARVPKAARYLARCQEELLRVEQQNTDIADAACHPYAELLGEVFADGNVLYSHILRDLGYNLGRWVYLIDALDDVEADEAAGRYNVYVNQAKKQKKTVQQMRGEARFSLFYTLSQAQAALERLELRRNREVLNNIIRLGLRRQTESVLAGQGMMGMVDESIRSARGL